MTVKYLSQDCKSVAKQVSATDNKSQSLYFKHFFLGGGRQMREGQAKDRNKILSEL
jgi:hypothetical protein